MSERNISSDEVVILDNKVIAPLGAFRISPISSYWHTAGYPDSLRDGSIPFPRHTGIISSVYIPSTLKNEPCKTENLED